jgi:hypothetical protein
MLYLASPGERGCRVSQISGHEYVNFVGRDSAVCTATRYGLNGPGSNPGGGRIIRTRSDRSWGQPSLQYNESRVSFPG